MLLVWLCKTTAAAEPLSAGRLVEGDVLRLDGRIDDPAWQRAVGREDFRQSQPQPGAPASQRTVVRLAYDEAHLYVAIEALEAEPERIVARQMQRDSELFYDDHVTVVLDPHGRAREGYLFRVNAAGARRDALIFEGQREDYDWDGRWRAAAHIHDTGWTAEIGIRSTNAVGVGRAQRMVDSRGTFQGRRVSMSSTDSALGSQVRTWRR